MPFQMIISGKLFATFVTLMFFVFDVHFIDVSFLITSHRKLAVTKVTFVGKFASMCDFVVLTMSNPIKDFSTVFTDEYRRCILPFFLLYF
eukprot:01496.XXX_1760_2029_1 [CDS] Oithona nana genome sequencing.